MSQPSVISLSEIRAHFPALTRVHAGRSVAYFDGPGGTQVPRAVVAAMTEYLYNHNANTHWQYPTSQETDAALLAARAALGDFFDASPSEIVFGANMTTLTFHVSRALGRGFAAGDQIVVTELDHHANVDPWHELARNRGLVVRTLPFRPQTGGLDLADLERLLTPRTRLLAIGAASNALGTISAVRDAARLAHAAGALVWVDAVHYAPHELVDVKALECDFLVASAYKFYGPHVGVLFGRHELLQRLDAPRLAPAPTAAPERIETGTLNHEGIVGAGAAVDFLAALAPGLGRRAALATAFAALHARGQALIERLWEGLAAVPGVTLHGVPPGRPRTPTVAFSVAGWMADDVALALARDALFVSSGDFYATTVVERLGHQRDGVVRAGCACYTSAEEIDRLIEGVRGLRRGPSHR